MEKRASTAWIYLASAALSMFGNAVAGIVWPWLVLERTGSPQAASIVAASIAVPSLLFAYFGGNLIDSVGRKPMSIVSDIISGLSVIGLIVVDSTTDLTLGWFIAIGIIGAVGDIPGMSARAALVGDVAVASGKDVPFLSGLNQGLGGISFLLGPAVAGFLMSALPIQNVLWITAGCSLGAAGLTALLRLGAPVAADEAEEADFAGWRGWRAALGFPVVRMLAVNTLLAMALVTPYLSVLLPARFQASGQPHLLGVSMSAYAVGMLLAGLVATKLASRERLTWALGMSLYIAGFGLMGFLHLPWLVIAGMAVSGLGGGVLNPLQMVVVTESVPEQIRGRTFSIFMAISQVAGPIGLAVTSVVLGFTTIYAIAAALAALWAVFAVVLIAWGLRLLKV
ncbi:MFS transporter [Corynebacterium vitaeruminis]|uniref:Multidrug efflux pump Tap n=1 Tax=Corynebacterium vitaeruminis DSM 20294 TaxID=1224164 RepID=W5XZ07_9CORY|nr:MFS transporter [Corynebacterium vitaeruminis]AHI22197.1 major facilitator superfamily transporter [Corynebacterium vitaeruminis DSM 20294]